MKKIKQKNPTSFWRTTDLSLAAVILLFRPLEAIDKKESQQKAEFIFAHDEELDGIVELYWRGELKLEPRSYFSALREIKARLYS